MSGNSIGSVIGGAVGFYFGGVTGLQYGMSIGGVAGGLLLPDKVGVQDQEGARLNDLKVTNSTYGASINKIYGSYRTGGTVIWSSDIKETKHVREEEVGKGGSETYDVTWYTYSVDMAIAFCEGPVSDIRRVWAGGVLIYDVNQGGWSTTFTNTEETSGEIQFYYGTDDQEVDWFLESQDPDTPAYRNTCYIRFKEFQLGMFGNRIPNITCEILSSSNITTELLPDIEKYPGYDAYSVMLNVENDVLTILNPSFTDGQGYVPGSYYSYDNFSVSKGAFVIQDGRNYIGSPECQPGSIEATIPFVGISLNGSYIVKQDEFSNDINSFYLKQKDSLSCVNQGDELFTSSYPGGGVTYSNYILYYIVNDDKFYILRDVESTLYFFPSGKSITPQLYSDVDLNSSAYMTYYDNTVYVIGSTSTNTIIIERYTSNLDFVDINYVSVSDILAPNQLAFASVDFEGIHCFGFSKYYHINHNLALERETSILTSVRPVNRPPMNYLYDRGVLYSMVQGDPVNIHREFLNSTENYGVTLSSIVGDLLLKSGITSNEMNLSDGDSVLVYGYSKVSISSARDEISILQSVYLFDLIENDFIITLRLRKDEEPSLEISNLINEVEILKPLDTELPKKITLEYLNSEKDYLVSSQYSQRIDGNSLNNTNLKLPISISDDTAKQLSEKLLFSTWSNSTTIDFRIPFTNTINPSDVVKIIDGGDIYTVRISGITYNSDNTLTCKSNVESDGMYISDATGDDSAGGFIPPVLKILAPSILNVFNSPTLSNEVIESPGIYYSVVGFNDNWTGAEVYKTKNNGATFDSIGAAIQESSFGVTDTALLPGPTTVWDFDNTVTLNAMINLFENVTIESMLSGNNYIMIGNEVLQYQEYIDNGDNTYTLYNLLRGRRGTEWAIDTHAINEPFTLLDNALGFNFGTINKQVGYKAVTFGTYIDDATQKDIACDGTNVKPFSVSRLKVEGLTISWLRRDRYISGYMRTLPLSETIERYKIDFLNGDVVMGTVYVDNVTEYTYSDIYQPMDRISVSQFSSVYGGYGYENEVLI